VASNVNRHESKRRRCSHRRMRSRWWLGGRLHSSKVARGIAVGFSRDVHYLTVPSSPNLFTLPSALPQEEGHGGDISP
jgi:hypothetical protein